MKGIAIKKALGLALGLMMVSSSIPASNVAYALPAASTCTVNWDNQKQVMDGFGASGAFHQASALMNFPEPARSKILDLLFSESKGVGLSIVRNIVGDSGSYGTSSNGPTASIEPQEGVWNWTGDKDQIWLMNQAKKRGCTKFMSTVWSPPAWMKTNNSVINGGSLSTDKYQAYADYLSNYVKGYKSHFGLDIYGISLANEPDISTSYSSCQWTGPQFRDFIKSNLTPTFKKDKVTAKVIMPESMDFNEDYALDTLNDPIASQGVDIVAAHDYDYGAAAFPVAQSQGKRIWQTEVCDMGTNDPTISDGLKYAKLINDQITTTGISAWNYWWLADTSDMAGGAFINLDPSTNTYDINKRLYAVGNYSRFIRPGYVRIDATANPVDNVYVTAYKDKGTGKFVIVALNTGVSDQQLSFNLNGFPTTASVTPYRTSDSENLAMLSRINVRNKAFSTTLAGNSITTFVSSSAELPAIHALKDIHSKIPAVNFTSQSGTKVFTDGTQGSYLGSISNGSYATYNNVNFGFGTAKGFAASVASVLPGGTMEIRLDSVTGPLIGTCQVPETAAVQTYTTTYTSISTVTGIHNVYLVFKGSEANNLYNLSWFRFTDGTQLGGELAVNPGFEDGTTNGWYNFGAGAITASNTTAHSGMYSGEVTGRTATWQGIAQGFTSKVEIGKTYQVSAWVKLDNATSDSADLSFKMTDESGTHYSPFAYGTVNNTGWTQITGKYTVKSNGLLMLLDLYVEGPASGVNFYVDDLSFKEVTN
jgi:glucuronoarabinoxylan endo-1,4-beta-xylanase